MKKKFTLYLIIISTIVTALALPLIFLARDLPPTPPSVIASKKEEPFDFKKECKLLMKNKNFLRIVACMTLTFSSYVTFLTNMDLLFKPWGYTAKDISIFNVLLIVSGLLGSLLSAKFLDRDNPKYKLIFNALTILGACLMALFLVTVPMHKAAFGVNLFLYGFCMIPTFSIIFPYVAELTYPCHEAVSTALMLMSCRIFATSFGFLGTILAEQGFFECSSFIIAATLIGMIPGLFISEELRKVSMKQFYTFFNHRKQFRKQTSNPLGDDDFIVKRPSQLSFTHSNHRINIRVGQAGEIVIENHELGSLTFSSQSVSSSGGGHVTPLYPVKGKLVEIKHEDVESAAHQSNPMTSKLGISPAFFPNSEKHGSETSKKHKLSIFDSKLHKPKPNLSKFNKKGQSSKQVVQIAPE